MILLDELTESRLSNLEKRQDKLDQKTDYLQQQQNDTNNRLTRIEIDTSYIKETVTKINSRWDKFDNENTGKWDKFKWLIVGAVISLCGSLVLTYIK